jgi:hypothetical protein
MTDPTDADLTTDLTDDDLLAAARTAGIKTVPVETLRKIFAAARRLDREETP